MRLVRRGRLRCRFWGLSGWNSEIVYINFQVRYGIGWPQAINGIGRCFLDLCIALSGKCDGSNCSFLNKFHIYRESAIQVIVPS